MIQSSNYNKELYEIFRNIRIQKGSKLDIDEQINEFLINDLNKLSMLYQIQLNNILNVSTLQKKHSKDVISFSKDKFHETMNKTISNLYQNFNIYEKELEEMIKRNYKRFSNDDLTNLKMMLDLNLILDINQIAFYYNNISKINQLIAIEILLINFIFNKLSKTVFFKKN